MSALSTNARQEYYIKLAGSLPPPAQDKPENQERRLKAAVETFEALRPGDAYEASLAVEIVLSAAHAAECLREAGDFRDDFAKRTRCRAQASSMMRAESSAKRALEREQKVRLAGEAVADAERGRPVQAATAAPPQPAPAAVAPLRPAAAKAGAPVVSRPAAVAPPSPEAIKKAEAFMQGNGVAAAQIRHDRGVTPQNKAYFCHVTMPTDPAVIDALVRGVSDLLSLLDEVGGEDLDTAA